MKFFKKLIFSLLGFFGIFGSSLTFATEGSTSEDFLNQAFSIALESDLVVGKGMIGNTKDWVGNFLLQGSTEVDIGKLKATKKDSFIVNLTRFLVRFTLVFAITMIIYNGIKFVIKSSKGEAPKDILQNIVFIVVGVLLALSSVVIIRLASSIGYTTLSIF